MEDASRNPTAFRTCSTRIVTIMVAGSTRTTTGLTTGGIVTTGSRSPCRNFLHFSPVFAGEFCLVSCPFHPPSILPASSNFTERAMYFLSSKDLVSQSTKRSTRKVSAFLIARRTYGCFSVGERKLAADIASITSTNNVSMRWPRE